MTTLAPEAPASAETSIRKASQLPTPKGYKLLITLPEAQERTESGLYKAPTEVQNDAVATMVGFVLRMGSDAYGDTKKFPTGPWCEEGDWVLFRPFSGTRVRIHGKEFRLINDDMVEAVVEDPQGIERA
jgi:co-chaperonin GroES (HSP10)